MKIEYFLNFGGDLDSFPLEYLCGLAEIRKTLLENNFFLIPKSVLLCLGVLPIPGESNSYAVLAWSSLPQDPKSSRTFFKYEAISKKVITYLSKQIPNASSLVDQKARKLWEATSKMLKCDACMTRGLEPAHSPSHFFTEKIQESGTTRKERTNLTPSVLTKFPQNLNS